MMSIGLEQMQELKNATNRLLYANNRLGYTLRLAEQAGNADASTPASAARVRKSLDDAQKQYDKVMEEGIAIASALQDYFSLVNEEVAGIGLWTQTWIYDESEMGYEDIPLPDDPMGLFEQEAIDEIHEEATADMAEQARLERIAKIEERERQYIAIQAEEAAKQRESMAATPKEPADPYGYGYV